MNKHKLQLGTIIVTHDEEVGIVVGIVTIDKANDIVKYSVKWLSSPSLPITDISIRCVKSYVSNSSWTIV